MNDEVDSHELSPAAALVPIDSEWRPIFHNSDNQVVLYNPTSHALTIRQSGNFPRQPRPPCPYCKQSLPLGFEPDSLFDGHDESLDAEPVMYSRASNYFRLLAVANETTSTGTTPRATRPPLESSSQETSAFPPGAMAEGYFKAFFQEECKLGMGANGSVYLCQHVLDGNPLGHFAVKKIAVGNSHSYLLDILREVRLLERLHHPNIITYHHAWLEACQFSSFGPRIPTLHVLMQWAEGGSLDDFIDARLGQGHSNVYNQHHAHPPQNPFAPSPSASPTSEEPTQHSSPAPSGSSNSRAARIRAFREFQKASPEEKARLRKMGLGGGTRNGGGNSGGPSWNAIHLLSADEIQSLFCDVVDGLAFLHNKSILHLDLKPGNVLLTWDDGRLVPRAMLSDFGTSRDMMSSGGVRSGNTGTLEYTAPESLPSPQTGLLRQIDSKADMWSLGMVLHKMLFFKLPYRYASRGNEKDIAEDIEESEKLARLEKEVVNYPGFKFDPGMVSALEVRRMPRAVLVLLESLLNPIPTQRPTIEKVSNGIRTGNFKPLRPDTASRGFRRNSPFDESSRLPVVQHRPQTHSQPRRSPSPPPFSGRRHSADGSVSSESEEYHDAPAGNNDREKAPLLGLPAPENADGERPETQKQPWGMTLLRILLRRDTRKWRAVGVRAVKSCLLVIKVLNLPDYTRSRIFLVGLAVLDMLLDAEELFGICLSGLLGMIHLGVLRSYRS
ncbi:putative serine/threonine-protein kinase iks1 [Marasmius sp. AFHP31]|nr:putative serine/threonine-protein kinase iks1 [Marasmius sp. AFHP31]